MKQILSSEIICQSSVKTCLKECKGVLALHYMNVIDFSQKHWLYNKVFNVEKFLWKLLHNFRA